MISKLKTMLENYEEIESYEYGAIKSFLSNLLIDARQEEEKHRKAIEVAIKTSEQEIKNREIFLEKKRAELENWYTTMQLNSGDMGEVIY